MNQEFRETLKRLGIYAGQPLGGPTEHTNGVFNRVANNGRTYTDLGQYLGKELPPGLLSFLEIHIQTWPDTESYLQGEHFAEQIDFLKSINSDLIVYAHAPYMKISTGERKPFHFSHLLLQPPASLVKEGKAQEIEPERFYPLITALAANKVPYLTVHLSTPGCFLDEDEFLAAREKIGQLARFAQERGVTIGMETGGVTGPQLESLAKIKNVQITWDEEHAMLDKLSEELFPRLLRADKIGLVHLAVPIGGEHNQGELYRASDEQRKRIGNVVRLVTAKNRKVNSKIPIMLETTPDVKNYKILRSMAGGL